MRHPTGGHADTDWKKVSLLVFGMDDQFRFLARQTFRKLMVREVTPYGDAAETQGLLGRGFDLLLVDLASDPGHALAVIEALRKPEGNPHRDLPVLVVAPSSMTEDINRAKALGIEGTIPKPVSGHELSHRVAETLANPQRMAAPAQAKPRVSALRDPDEVSVPGKPAPQTVAQPRVVMPSAPAAAASVSAPRPDRSGPWSAVVGVSPASVPTSALAPGRGFASAGSEPPARRAPSGGGFDAEDLLPVAAKPTGGRLGEEDLAGTPFDPDAEARRKAAERRRQQWQEAMAQSGHKARTGGDVAKLDLSSVVAEHGLWLQSNGAEGKRATFTGMDLAGADLAGTLLPNASFREVDLSDACLAEARLDGSDFRYAILEGADLAGANLGVAALRHARLRLCNLEGASLRGSDLSGAVLSGAKTAGADFKGAVLVGADLSGADLSRAEGLTQAQMDKTLCNLDTRLPPGLSRPAKAE